MSLKKTIVLLLLSTTMLLNAREMLIRDVSWSGYTYFEPTSFYVLLDPIYDDKITFLEEQWGETNFIFSWLGGLIPRQWNINVGQKTTVWNYDAFDAMYVGIQGANADITQASLNLLPVSKAVIETGKTVDYRFKEIMVEGKFDLSQFITLNYECMTGLLNKYRIHKTLNLLTAGAIAVGTTQAKIADKILPNGLSLNTGKVKDVLIGYGIPKWVIDKGYLLTILPLAAAVGTQRIENIYLNGYIKNFEILMNSDKVRFDKKQAKEYLAKLIKKVNRFGCGRKYAKRLDVLMQKL